MMHISIDSNDTPPSPFTMNVRSWPIIEWSAGRIQQIALLHLASRCDEAAARLGFAARYGSTLWCGLVSSGLVGLSWSWQQIAPGVLVIADPMAIRSNLRWLGDDGHVLGEIAEAALHNRLVAGLCWRQVVRESACAHVLPPIVSWQGRPSARN